MADSSMSAPTIATNAVEADCAREPIHIPGGIQPHGYLLSVGEGGIVVQVSANIGALVHADADAVLGQPLASVLGERGAQLVATALRDLDAEGIPLYAGSIDDPRGNMHAPLAIVVHRYDGATIVELEPARDTSDVFASMYPLVRTFINSLQDVDDADALAVLAAREVHRITGYGRTLVYSFDDDGHGHVIAESLSPGYAGYLGQRFPASDIPPQARALYVRNRIRLIADADYVASPLVPPLHPATGRTTDLTYASLRSISPVHVQYMKNMGTWSSMSMSIVVRGRLWGLISCHHDTARVPPFEVRTACEHIAQVLSLQIEAKEDHAEADYRLELRRRQARLLASMANSEDFIDAIAADPRDLLDLPGATGAAVIFEGRVVRMGEAPPTDVIERLVGWFDKRTEDVYATDNLAEAWPEAATLSPSTSGLLAVSLSRLFRNYVIWFRPEVVRTIRWAGDPRAKLSKLSPSLSPRESFEVWTQTVRNRSAPWRQAEIEIAGEFRGALLNLVLRRAEELAQLALELGRVNRELEGFSYTVSHDLRAPLRHIVGYADLLREMEQARLSDRGRHFVERIIAQARFGGKLVDDLLSFSQMGRAALRAQPLDLDELVSRVIADETRDLGDRQIDRRIEWEIGKLGIVNADPVLMVVVLRNLISNAIKFTGTRTGADGQPPARIAITRTEGERLEGDRRLPGQDVITVQDNGVGFDMRYADKLFGVFQRLHRFEDFPGTGIGLASVRRIVERHGGTAWAEGQLDRGATIAFSLPRDVAPETVPVHETVTETAARLAAVSSGQPYRPVFKDTKKVEDDRAEADPAG
ncbi:ATP-binding protein [Cupriavidus plantarum]|uniref:histidine kinase n=1 Tax=Cupriavidus plantarum TaxID=942865 RepID=A0A316FC14_9BURK|nr:ATP-binding protein [Cupriavidus plantarum]PWK34970.1 phytochrome sensor signal transduction histidine kinase [Cupriavidus plantarum]CAG2136917.1 Phytochrome-like protein cph1 [Cupriavidus plantarum]SMR84826.1 phytochrome sensor signal transduction histidine kinase [Cupriavidus plantarum]